MESATYHSYVPFKRIKEDLLLLKGLSIHPEIRISGEDLDRLKMKDVEKMARELDGSGVVTVHAPYRDLSPGAFDARVRAAARERLEELVEVAAEFKTRSIVCHLGFDPRQHRKQVDEWVANSLETWSRIAGLAQEAGIQIVLENVYEDTPDPHLRILKELSAPNVGICFDVGHAHIYSKLSKHEWMQKLGSAVREVHLHDNDGSDDQHMALGRGTIDFEALVKEDIRLLDSPMLTFEVLDRNSIEACVRRVKELLGK